MFTVWRALLLKGKTAYRPCLLDSYELMSLCQQYTVRPLHYVNFQPILSITFYF